METRVAISKLDQIKQGVRFKLKGSDDFFTIQRKYGSLVVFRHYPKTQDKEREGSLLLSQSNDQQIAILNGCMHLADVIIVPMSMIETIGE